MCHNWRGNVDLQIILDHQAAIDYMVKYATKSEKPVNFQSVPKSVQYNEKLM
jgi:hypothetical protein